MTKDISALLDELKSLHAKATEGEWENCRGFVRSKLPVSGTLVNGATIHLSRTWVAETIRGEGYVPDNGNADFIAAIKNAFPALVAAIEAAREDAERYQWLRDTKKAEVCIEDENEDGPTGALYQWTGEQLAAAIDRARGR